MGDGGDASNTEVDRRFSRIVDRIPAPVVVVAADSSIIYVNESLGDALGRPIPWLVGRKLLDLVHADDQRRARRHLVAIRSGRHQARLATYRISAIPENEWRIFECYGTNLLDDPGIRGILLAGRDITEERAYQRQLREVAYRDPLTGLPNRLEVHELLDRLLKTGTAPAVGFVGLDRFKLINDSLGHTTGDAVLQIAASRIAQSLPHACIAARFNGDVFAVVVPKATVSDVAALLWRIVERIGEPLFLAGHELRLPASAGVVYGSELSTTESLLRDAGSALHLAKTRGGGRVEQFEPSMRQAAIARFQVEANLRLALSRSQFTLALQPVVQLASAEPVGAEALLRWHDGKENVPPAKLITVAEETGIVVPLGDWIIDRAAQLVSQAPGGRVVVNLSGRQLASPGLADRIARTMHAHRLPPGSLAFEVTETLLIDEFDYAAAVLRSIRDLGCQVGLDDFGTGYSSLSYLRRLPIDFLKIDSSLASDVHRDAQARAIVGAIITMADALGMQVIAEGIETHAQAQTLQELGCTHGQGFLFGHPFEV